MRTQSVGTNPQIHPHDHLIPQMLDDVALKALLLRKTRAGKWGCIEWTGGRAGGYGSIGYGGVTMVAHRVSWILRNRRPVPYDFIVDHLCCNTACVNPDHLEAITAAENAYRRDKAPAGWVSVRSPRFPRRRKLKGTRMTTPPNRLFPPSAAA